jgi:hypothetical protein
MFTILKKLQILPVEKIYKRIKMVKNCPFNLKVTEQITVPKRTNDRKHNDFKDNENF